MTCSSSAATVIGEPRSTWIRGGVGGGFQPHLLQLVLGFHVFALEPRGGVPLSEHCRTSHAPHPGGFLLPVAVVRGVASLFQSIPVGEAALWVSVGWLRCVIVPCCPQLAARGV